ncbi:MAG: alpha/beta fold hydrolase [Myxococcota bacterium]
MPRAAPAPLECTIDLPSLRLEGGASIDPVRLHMWWWGPEEDLDVLEPLGAASSAGVVTTPEAPSKSPATGRGVRLDAKLPTILVVHALTGDARVGGRGGWWTPLVGEGRPLDPSRARILCFNNLGSCYGSSGPRQRDWPWTTSPKVGVGPVSVPAPVTTWDQARLILRGLDFLGLDRVRVGLGGSLGGMLVLSLGALAPERFAQLIPIAASAAASPWIIGFNHIARQTILSDAQWPDRPERGLSLARQLAQMTYRAEPGLIARQGRALRPEVLDGPEPFTTKWQADLPYAQETYLEHQGRKLVERFDAPSYLVQLGAMDHHDLQRRPPAPDDADSYRLPSGPWSGLDRLGPRIDGIGIDSDALYAPGHLRALAAGHPERRYFELRSAHGHDAFLIEWDQLDEVLRTVGAPFDTTR